MKKYLLYFVSLLLLLIGCKGNEFKGDYVLDDYQYVRNFPHTYELTNGKPVVL